MNRFTKGIFCAIVLTCAIAARAQSLGDVARQQKSTPKPKATKVYTDENLPSTPKVAPAAKPDTTEPAATKANPDQVPENKDAKAQPDNPKQRDEAYKAKIVLAKAKVADVEHEVELMQREYKLRSAVFYSDAGNRLRDDKKWADDERRYKTDLAARQQDLQGLKDKLDALREEARKAGVEGALD